MKSSRPISFLRPPGLIRMVPRLCRNPGGVLLQTISNIFWSFKRILPGVSLALGSLLLATPRMVSVIRSLTGLLIIYAHLVFRRR